MGVHASVGVVTALMAATIGLVQTDIKKVLAYSTVSQLGYMFLATGVGAFAAAAFHLMTHAFFKALLFLGAGAVVYSLHHEHDIFKMGGLRKKLPVAFWSFLIGSAALAALPFTSGFYSKDAILLAAYDSAWYGPVLWGVGLIGALLTSIYSFRLVFIVFFGEIRTEPSEPAGWIMAGPLLVLCTLSVLGGLIVIPVSDVFPFASGTSHHGAIAIITPAVPIIGVLIAYLIFLRHSVDVRFWTESSLGQTLNRFWFNHWAMDWLYDALLVKPYAFVAAINKKDIIDWFYNTLADVTLFLHELVTQSQTGLMRTYAGVMALGLVLLSAIALGVIEL